MQRGLIGVRAARHRVRLLLHRRNDASMQHVCPAQGDYGVHVRNINPVESGTWATMVRDARAQLQLSQQALADRVGVDRTTVWRWENKNQRPDTLEIAERAIAVLNLNRDAALIATRYLTADPKAIVQPPPDPRLRGLSPNDRVVQHIMTAPVTERQREVMLNRRRQQLAHRDAQDIAELQFWIESQGAQQDSDDDNPGRVA